jgi:uncharacterized protein involved in outer membrane biogenesis
VGQDRGRSTETKEAGMKKILIGIVIVVVIIAIGVYVLLSNLDSLVEKAIEKHGSQVTQTGVSVSGVKISLREGRGTISGLQIESPDGYSAQNAFSLDDITLDIDIKSLRSDLIVIDEIRIVAPEVFVEATKAGSTNITDLRKNIEESIVESSGESGDASKGKEKRILIKLFVFEKGKIEVDASALGMENRTLDLPAIRMSDIGGADGFYPDKIGAVILDKITERVASEVAKSEIRGTLDKKIDEGAGKLLDKIKN